MLTKTNPAAALLLSLVWGLWGISTPASAQEGRLTLVPPFDEIFPTENMTDGVHLEYPVLVNDHVEVNPGAILCFIYLDPNAGAHGRVDEPGNGFHSHVGPGGALVQGGDNKPPADKGGAAGWGDNDGSDTAGIFDAAKEDMKRRKEELQNEVWKSKDLFDDALVHATELGTTLVYTLPGQDRRLFASFDLPEGLLLAEMKGRVRVLGLKEDSRSYVGGIRPGDEIHSFRGGEEMKTLGDFMRSYSEMKRKARLTGDPSYEMEIFRPGTSQNIAIQIAAPPTIPSFLKDSYSSPLEQKP